MVLTVFSHLCSIVIYFESDSYYYYRHHLQRNLYYSRTSCWLLWMSHYRTLICVRFALLIQFNYMCYCCCCFLACYYEFDVTVCFSWIRGVKQQHSWVLLCMILTRLLSICLFLSLITMFLPVGGPLAILKKYIKFT